MREEQDFPIKSVRCITYSEKVKNYKYKEQDQFCLVNKYIHEENMN